MFDSHDKQKDDLECLRLASDCMQLADSVLNPALQAHLIEMARAWTAIVENGEPGPTLH